MPPAERYIAPAELTPKQQLLVREALGKLLLSDYFSKSKRYPAILEFSVTHTLENETTELKERTLGVEIFGRPLDYDPASDPIVRISAVEVRKRLTAYFNSHPEAPVRIDIPLGAYMAGFYFRVPSQENADDQSDQNAPQEAPPAREVLPASPTPLISWRIWTAIFSATLVLMVLSAAVTWRLVAAPAMPDLWRNFSNSKSSIMVILGTQPDERITPSTPPRHAFLQDADSLATLPQNNHFTAIGNAVASARIGGILHAHNMPFHIVPAQDVSLADLRETPVVLIGDLDNPWTQFLLKPLRYQPTFEQQQTLDQRNRYILDRQNPALRNWSTSSQEPLDEADYAIIARFYSMDTDNNVLAVAGLSQMGTASAANLISSLGQWDHLLMQSKLMPPSGNFEAVLRVETVKGKPGHCSIIAFYTW